MLPLKYVIANKLLLLEATEALDVRLPAGPHSVWGDQKREVTGRQGVGYQRGESCTETTEGYSDKG